MPNERRERTVTVSGLKGYFPLTEEEQGAYRIEFFFSASNLGEANYFNYEWYEERTLYGRFKFARGKYTLKEKLIQYQNECIYTEEATLSETLKRIQCLTQRIYEADKYLMEGLAAVSAFLSVPLFPVASSTALDQIPPQPIGVPGLQVDGVYYNMFPGCAGDVTIQTWYDDDICKDVNGNPLTKNNRGKPPEPKVSGTPPKGTDQNVPDPTYPPGSNYEDPNPGNDVPTDTIANPTAKNGISGTFYTLHYRDFITATGVTRGTGTVTILGGYGKVIARPTDGGQTREWVIQTAIGVASVPQPNFTVLISTTGLNQNGEPFISIEATSIVPQ